MPKLKPAVQALRREHILDAAERCFARAGFHRTTMHDICKEANVSSGALYVYFDSKEALIAGISERDRNNFAQRFAALAAAPDVMVALEKLGQYYFEDEPRHRALMCIEIGIESTRNAKVGEIFRSVDTFVSGNFEALFRRLESEDRIAPRVDIPTLVRMLMVLGDGMFWRRVVDPRFDVQAALPAVLATFGMLLNPVPARDQPISAPPATTSAETVR